MTLKGGLGPSLLPDALAGKSPDYLRHVIAKGVPGKAMPPWEPILAPAEIDFLVEHLSKPPAGQEQAL
jgi:cytochrome c55X